MAKEEDNLAALLKHPEVKKRLNWGVLKGLSGRTRLDSAIGAVERTIEELEKVNAVPDSLREMYDRLKEDPQYAKHFPQLIEPLYPKDRRKNPAYKAINGF